MPDTGIAIKAVIGIAVLVTIAGLLGWFLDHPVVLILFLAAVGGGFYFWKKQKAAKDMV